GPAPSRRRAGAHRRSLQVRRSGRELREPPRFVIGDQGVDDLVQRAPFHHLVELVEREVDAMVGDAALGEIVGADAFAAVAAADLALAVGGARLVAALALGVVQAGAQGLAGLWGVPGRALFILCAD